MNRTVALLGVLLGVSLLLNVVAFRRGPGEAPASSAERRTEKGAAAEPAAAATSDALKAELERERKLVRELREQVRRLEADREVLALAATTPGAAPAAKAPAGNLREKLRKMKKLFKTAEKGEQPDQEEMLEMSGEMMELMKLGLARRKDPRLYAELLQASTEVALEDEAALAPDQAAAMAKVLEEMADALGRLDGLPSGERLIRELELESAAVARLQTLFTPAQADVLKKGGLDDMASMSSAMGTTWLSKATAADQVVKKWTSSYELQESQKPAARAAAELFLRSMEGIDTGLKPGAQGAESNWGQLTYDKRIAALRAQSAALKTLEGALTAAQREKLRTASFAEFRVADFATTAVEAPDDK